MKRKFQKKLMKAINNNDCEKVIRLCRKAACCPHITEELILRALFTNNT